MTSKLLYLTAKEQDMFDAVPEALHAEIEVKTERRVESRMESEDELLFRLQNFPIENFPAVKVAGQKIKLALEAGIKLEDISVSLPEELMPFYLYVLGIRGITHFMEMLLSEAKTEQDIDAIGGLSRARHSFLQTQSLLSTQPV